MPGCSIGAIITASSGGGGGAASLFSLTFSSAASSSLKRSRRSGEFFFARNSFFSRGCSFSFLCKGRLLELLFLPKEKLGIGALPTRGRGGALRRRGNR